MLNSCLDLFSAALFPEHPLFRSYGVNLPSSLTTLLPLALESSSYLPVSVCGTGALDIRLSFLVSVHACFPTNFGPFRPGQPTPGIKIHIVSVYLNYSGYGISTVCASTTPFGLALAPGSPREDDPSPGNLRFSAITILTQFSLLIPAFSLELSPHLLPLMLHP